MTKQLQDLTTTLEAVEQERQAEVWKAFCHVLEQFATVLLVHRLVWKTS